MSLNNFNKKKWFVLYTKPKHEFKVSNYLLKIGIESCCPTININKIWSDRIKKIGFENKSITDDNLKDF